MEVEQARQAGWIEVSAPVDVAFLALLRRDLDDGESEVIAMAVEKQQKKHFNSLKVELDRLLNQGGFWVEQRLYNQALNAVGEIKL